MYICASEVETQAKRMMKDSFYETKTHLDKSKLQGTFFLPFKMHLLPCHGYIRPCKQTLTHF